jgi:hypothetical protein
MPGRSNGNLAEMSKDNGKTDLADLLAETVLRAIDLKGLDQEDVFTLFAMLFFINRLTAEIARLDQQDGIRKINAHWMDSMKAVTKTVIKTVLENAGPHRH